MGGLQTVLVVADDAAIRLLCRVNLELEGFRVLEAPTLRDARLALDAEAVDVVLLDLHVGEEDGWSLADELRDRDDGVKVALLSGAVDLPPAEAARVDAVVPKPFTLEALGSAVRNLAAVRSATR